MLHGAIINFRRRIVNQTRGFSCRVAAQFNQSIQRMGASRFAQSQLVSLQRLAPTADACRWAAFAV